MTSTEITTTKCGHRNRDKECVLEQGHAPVSKAFMHTDSRGRWGRVTPHLLDMIPAKAEAFLDRSDEARRARGFRHDDDALTVMDWFCGAGGSSQGMHSIPGVRMERAANHWERAIESHAANFPTVDHYRGDIREAPVETWPVTDIFWASPECPQWSNARGKKRDFDASLQGDLSAP